MKPIGEQVIVITGASSGIGRATAIAAARRGARVALAARNAADLESLARDIRDHGGEAIAVPTDVRDAGQVEALARRTVDEWGRIDTWVNNAAVSLYGTFADTPADDFRALIETNLMGQVHGAKAAIPRLEETGGALVCVGSALSDRGVPLQTAYCASKHAIKGWLDGLRTELRRAGSPVRVTLVKPASINTPLFEKARTYLGVEPRPIPPVYAPALAAAAILRAAESAPRDLFVGGAGVAFSIAERISPRLVDLHQAWRGFSSQSTARPRAADAPSNLHAHLPWDGGIRGDFSDREKAHSLYQPVTGHGAAATLAAVAAAGLAALALRRAARDRGRRR